MMETIVAVGNAGLFVIFAGPLLCSIGGLRELAHWVNAFWQPTILLGLLLANTALLIMAVVSFRRRNRLAEYAALSLLILNVGHLGWGVIGWVVWGGTDRSWVNFLWHGALVLVYCWCALNTRRYFRSLALSAE